MLPVSYREKYENFSIEKFGSDDRQRRGGRAEALPPVIRLDKRTMDDLPKVQLACSHLKLGATKLDRVSLHLDVLRKHVAPL